MAKASREGGGIGIYEGFLWACDDPDQEEIRLNKSEGQIKDQLPKLQAENQKLRKVAEAAEAEVERLRLHIWAAKEWMLPASEAWKILEQAEKEGDA